MTSHNTPTDPCDAARTGQTFCCDSCAGIVRVSQILAGAWDDPADEPRGRCIVWPGDTPEQTVARMSASLRAESKRRRRI